MRASVYIIPFFVMIIVFYGMYKKVNIYESFLEGVLEGLKTVVGIIPALVAMIFAVNVFLSSDFIGFVMKSVGWFFEWLKIPVEILPMALLRPVSGTASLAIMSDIFIDYGPDSFIGRLASTLQGCTDTTIYVLALYFSSVRINKTRHALGAGLFADMVGIVASFAVVKLFFG